MSEGWVRMKVALYKMTPQGIIATSYMLLQIIIMMLPPGVFRGEPFMSLAISIMRLPANLAFFWTVMFTCDGPHLSDLIIEPLKIIMNAYFWGYLLVWVYDRIIGNSAGGRSPPNHV